MPEVKTMREHKDLKPGLLILILNGELVEQIDTTGADKIDVSLLVTEKKG